LRLISEARRNRGTETAKVVMKRSVLIVLLAAFSFSAMAQNPSPAPATAHSKAQNQMTNCPPSNPSNAKPIEDNAIVPEIGGEKNSAAPTVQRQGEAAVVSPNCAT
jgi:hypothetical protein